METKPMERDQLEHAVAELLRETGQAHHQAFAATDCADPDWAIWYAQRLEGRLPQLLGASLSQTEICRALADLAEEHEARKPDADWARFYAAALVERFGSGAVRDDLGEERLALYHFEGCPFCTVVRHEIDRLGIDVELRDIFDDPAYRRELIEARGRGTVPVLRCTGPAGDRWMPESRDIVRYLRARFAA